MKNLYIEAFILSVAIIFGLSKVRLEVNVNVNGQEYKIEKVTTNNE